MGLRGGGLSRGPPNQRTNNALDTFPRRTCGLHKDESSNRAKPRMVDRMGARVPSYDARFSGWCSGWRPRCHPDDLGWLAHASAILWPRMAPKTFMDIVRRGHERAPTAQCRVDVLSALNPRMLNRMDDRAPHQPLGLLVPGCRTGWGSGWWPAPWQSQVKQVANNTMGPRHRGAQAGWFAKGPRLLE